MGMTSWVHWVILGLVVLLLFGKGRFSGMMGDVAKGIKEFKKGMAEEDTPPTTQVPPRIEGQPHTPQGYDQQQAPSQPTIDGKPVPPHDPRI